MNETATGKIRHDGKKPPAIRTNRSPSIEPMSPSIVLWDLENLACLAENYTTKGFGKIFLPLKTARTPGEGFFTSSSDSLRKCSYDSFTLVPSLLCVQCWRETSKMLKSMRKLCGTIAVKCRWNSLENSAERLSGERKSREEEVDVMFRRLWRKQVQQWRQLDCLQSATIIPRKRQISSVLTANVVGC